MQFRKTFRVVPLGFAIATSSLDAQTIDTRSGAPLDPWIYNAQTVGQAFIAPNNAAILTASLWLGTGSPQGLSFRAYLQQWSGTEPNTCCLTTSVVGPVLYESDALLTIGNDAPGTRFDFDLGGISLITGARYVFYAKALTPKSQGSTLSGFFSRTGVNGTNLYAGGNAVQSDNEPTPLHEYDFDAAFVATFRPVTTVPEPGTLALLLAVIVPFGGVCMRRRRVSRCK